MQLAGLLKWVAWAVIVTGVSPSFADQTEDFYQRVGFGVPYWVEQVRMQLQREPQRLQSLQSLNPWHEEILARMRLLENAWPHDEILDLSIQIVSRILGLIVERDHMTRSDQAVLLMVLGYIIRYGDQHHLDSFESAASLYPYIESTTFKKEVVPSFRAAFMRLTYSRKSCRDLL